MCTSVQSRAPSCGKTKKFKMVHKPHITAHRNHLHLLASSCTNLQGKNCAQNCKRSGSGQRNPHFTQSIQTCRELTGAKKCEIVIRVIRATTSRHSPWRRRIRRSLPFRIRQIVKHRFSQPTPYRCLYDPYRYITGPEHAFRPMFMRVLTDLTDPTPQGLPSSFSLAGPVAAARRPVLDSFCSQKLGVWQSGPIRTIPNQSEPV